MLFSAFMNVRHHIYLLMMDQTVICHTN